MSETRDPILKNMEEFYHQCHDQIKEMHEKLKIATVANEQFKADLHQRDAELANLREVLRMSNIEVFSDGSHQFKPKAIKHYCGERVGAELAQLREKLAAANKELDGVIVYHHAIQMYQTNVTNDDTARLRKLYGHALDCQGHINKALAIIDGNDVLKEGE